jgi:hypothetical protein
MLPQVIIIVTLIVIILWLTTRNIYVTSISGIALYIIASNGYLANIGIGEVISQQ